MTAAPGEPAPARFTAERPSDTQALAARLARVAQPGDVVALSGDLGAGKTCFVQGFASGLGVTGPVTSPTFIMIAEHAGRIPLYHVDLYRTERLEEIRALGLEELFDGDGVTLVEWAEKADPLLPERTLRVRILGVGDERRTIEMTGALRLDSAPSV